jgi:hypothetical protein
LHHIDFPLPRKHKPALFMAIDRAPLTTPAAPMRTMHRRRAPRPAWAPFADHLMQIFMTRITIG